MFNALILLAFLCREQPPSGGCVLKLDAKNFDGGNAKQPPSGGCVLKLHNLPSLCSGENAATFGWLCVETSQSIAVAVKRCSQPPSGGCVLKRQMITPTAVSLNAATFGWLCVETCEG